MEEDGWRKNYRYSVYEYRLVTMDGLSYTRPFIVVKNRYDVIVRFTRIHKLAIGPRAFGGLCLGKVCNVRQERSPKVARILFTFVEQYKGRG